MTELSCDLTAHGGFKFHVRPVRPDDEATLGAFFACVTPEDLRFRFLSSVKEVGHDQLVAMTRVDHRQTESFLAFEQGTGSLIATAMLACDPKLDVGEVAICVRADHKGLGIGWELLGHVTRHAQSKGVKRLQSLESRANGAAIQLEKELGFTAETYQGDSTLVMLQKILVES
jgi:N-acetylglutamate synthase-like GNAT family acetyltransferase